MANDQTPGSQNGQQPPPAGDDDNQPDLNTLVNSAVTAQLKRALSPKALAAVFAPLMGDVLKPLQDEIAALKAAPPPPPNQPPPPDPNKPSPEVTALKQKLQEFEDKFRQANDRAAAAEAKQRNDTAFANLKNHLTAAKVRPEMVDTLAKVLFYADKRVEFDEAGNTLFRVRVSPGKGLPEEEQTMTLEEGVRSYVKSKEAEPFLPAPGGAPAAPGQQRRPSPIAGGQPPVTTAFSNDPKERDVQLRAALASQGINLPDI